MSRASARSIFFLVAILFLNTTASAQDKLLTLDDLYDPEKRVNFSGNPPARLTWLDDRHYMQGASRVNALTGAATPFFDAAKMEAALAKLPGVGVDDAKQIVAQIVARPQLSADRAAALINYANDLFYYKFGSAEAVRLTNTADEEVGEEFSPDGKMVSFVKNYNIYVVDIATQRERSLTLDGNPKLFNGRLDWVYQEELYGRGNFKGYWWSPDASKIVYLQLDESQVKDFTVVDQVPNPQNLEVYAYPKSGMPNPTVKLGVVNVAGGATRWMDLFKYQTVEPLIVRVGLESRQQEDCLLDQQPRADLDGFELRRSSDRASRNRVSRNFRPVGQHGRRSRPILAERRIVPMAERTHRVEAYLSLLRGLQTTPTGHFGQMGSARPFTELTKPTAGSIFLARTAATSAATPIESN